jgi:hypothetical protein
VTYFLEYTDFSLAVEHICSQQGLDFLETWRSKKLPFLRLKPESWFDLEATVLQDEDLFGETKPQTFLISIENLLLDNKILPILEKLQASKSYFYLTYSNDEKLLADSKKLLKKANIDFIQLKKPDSTRAFEIAQKHTQNIDLKITATDLQKLTKQASGYQQLIDELDFIWLSGDSKKAVESLLIEEELPIFMMSFKPENAKNDSQKWYKRVREDDVQLLISLLFTKVSKDSSNLAKKLIQELILVDQKSKTISKVGGSVWLKYWLWKAENLISLQ